MRPNSGLLLALTGAVIGVLSTIVSAGPTPDQTFKLLAADGAASDRFGQSVAIDAGIAIIGSYGDDDLGSSSGSAYLFDVATGQFLRKLLPSDGGPGDGFGFSVAIADGIALVGMPDDDDTASAAGAAYLFDVATGQQLFKLLADDGAANDEFGYAVALSDGVAIVGTDRNGFNGAAYLFSVATGQQLHRLEPLDSQDSDGFGLSVDIDKGTAIVGAWYNNGKGAAYLFSVATGDQTAKLVSTDLATGDNLGFSVAIEGNIALVGARFDGDFGLQSGSAYLFSVGAAQQLHKLLPDDGASGDFFGYAVGLSQGVAMVTADGDDDNGSSSGSAYLFDVDTGDQCAKFLAADGQAVDNFGYAAAIAGQSIIASSPQEDDRGSNAGAAYLFAFDAPCIADLAPPFGMLDFFDLAAFLSAFSNQLPPADLAPPEGVFDFFDLQAFLGAYSAGCP